MKIINFDRLGWMNEAKDKEDVEEADSGLIPQSILA